MSKARSIAKRGHECRREKQFVEAGDQYTHAAYTGFAESEFRKMTKLSSAVYWLLCSGLCYRLGDRLDRCQNRCRQGVLIAEDLRQGPFQDDALRGLRDEEAALTGLTYE